MDESFRERNNEETPHESKWTSPPIPASKRPRLDDSVEHGTPREANGFLGSNERGYFGTGSENSTMEVVAGIPTQPSENGSAIPSTCPTSTASAAIKETNTKQEHEKVWDGVRPLQIGDQIAARSGGSGSKANLWYRARIVEITGPKVLVHYNGWNRRHDEWHRSDSLTLAAVRFLEAEEAAAAAAAAAAAEASMEATKIEPSAAEVAARGYTVVENGYVHLRQNERGDSSYRAFYCVPADGVHGHGSDGPLALASLLPSLEATRVYIGSFTSRKLGLQTLADEAVIEQCYRAILAGPKRYRTTLPCTECNGPFDVICIQKAPRVADWVCEQCEAAKAHLAPLLRGGNPSRLAEAKLNFREIREKWLKYHAQETRDLRLMRDGVVAMSGMADELKVECEAATETYVLAEVGRSTAHKRQQQLKEKIAWYLSTLALIRSSTPEAVKSASAAPSEPSLGELDPGIPLLPSI